MYLSTQSQQMQIKSGVEIALPVPSGVQFLVGTMVALNLNTGVLANATDAQYLRVIGVNYDRPVLGNAAGTTLLKIHRGAFRVPNSVTEGHAVAETNAGQLCYIESIAGQYDDDHVSIVAGTYNVIAGRVLSVEVDPVTSISYVWLEPVSELLEPIAQTPTASATPLADTPTTAGWGNSTSAAFSAQQAQLNAIEVDLKTLILNLKTQGILR